ncbi:MAG: hypothetical protein K8F52_05585 [Candidatus Scalindua rubra]|uniref:Uncharacterized protein n=1 Tax=Candidatus Scalindua brodae TaxID=237368 RepID=A0A0B0ELE2_9BACT|nr:MAG: hypothetical protein SCABRO_00835 [Candidatus Scalindua brodae]MBZ0108119.1 hypothetical protein [Candidatus Scalindua rubra]TWU31262.1 hypothetical protein S225a_22080 [Candidatus Brocadiaceae bacterium S225]
MEVKTIKDILKLQNEFVEKVQKQTTLIRKGKATSVDVLIKEKESLLVRMEERLGAATEAREKAVHRYDEEIRHHKEQVTCLKKEVSEEKQTLSRATVNVTKQSKEIGNGKRNSKGQKRD